MNERELRKEKNATEQYYSVHTFECSLPLPVNRIAIIQNQMKDWFTYSPGRTKVQNQKYKDWRLDERRIGECKQTICYDNLEWFQRGISNVCIAKIYGVEKATNRILLRKAYLTFQVNPRILLGEERYPYICIAPAERLKEVIPALYEQLSRCGISREASSYLKLRRLDYCSNIDLGSQEKAERYLKLLRKGGIYRAYNWKCLEYDKKQKRFLYPKHEVRYCNAAPAAIRREELSIYLKYAQMIESGRNYTREELEAAKGQIRIEQRVWRAKLYYLEQREEYESLEDFFSQSHRIGAEILENYLYGLYGTGKLVRYKKAIELIQASHHRYAVRKRMEEIVRETRKYDFAAACEPFKPSRRSEIRRYFNELGISPITLRDSWEEESFENPVTYIQTYNVNER